MKKVGIIMVGYQDYVNRYLVECRDSLRAQSYPKEFTNIYIVDNCSINDGEYVKNTYPEAMCVTRPDGNYAAANNRGIELARADGCEFFVIANMDTKFDKNWLKELIDAVESDEKIGVAQSKMLLYPKTEEEWKKPKVNSLGNMMHFLGFGFTYGYNEDDRIIEGLPEIEGYASGCSFVIKKEVLNIIGPYDEEYYMYHDDIEMGWRVKLTGYKTVLAPKSIMYHKYEFNRSIRMLYYMERNRHLAMLHYYKLPTLFVLLPAIIGMELGMFFYSIVNGWFKTELKVLGYFVNIKNWSKIVAKRREINKIRKISDAEIVKSFQGKVLFQEIENPVLKYIANPIFNLYWQIVKKIIVW